MCTLVGKHGQLMKWYLVYLKSLNSTFASIHIDPETCEFDEYTSKKHNYTKY